MGQVGWDEFVFLCNKSVKDHIGVCAWSVTETCFSDRLDCDSETVLCSKQLATITEVRWWWEQTACSGRRWTPVCCISVRRRVTRHQRCRRASLPSPSVVGGRLTAACLDWTAWHRQSADSLDHLHTSHRSTERLGTDSRLIRWIICTHHTVALKGLADSLDHLHTSHSSTERLGWFTGSSAHITQ